MRRYLALCVSIVAISCSNPMEVRTNVARITTDGQAIVVVNITNVTLYYLPVNRDQLALFDWAPCNDPSKCTGIAAGAEQRIAFSDVALYRPGAEDAVVYYWLLVRGESPSGFVADSIRATIVSLK